MSKKENNNVDPTVVKKWIAIIIAVLSAIAGAIGGNAATTMFNI